MRHTSGSCSHTVSRAADGAPRALPMWLDYSMGLLTTPSHSSSAQELALTMVWLGELYAQGRQGCQIEAGPPGLRGPLSRSSQALKGSGQWQAAAAAAHLPATQRSTQVT